MRLISLLLILIVSGLGTACHNEVINNAANFEFETVDKETNKFGLIVTVRYRLKSRLEDKLSREYDGHYKDSLLLPVISSISEKQMKDYPIIEIYNYKRDEIEQKLGAQIKAALAEYDIESTAFLIRSVVLSDTLHRRLEKEHVTRYESAMNNCTREIIGVITIHRDNVGFYEFLVENKNYSGMLAQEDFDKVDLGDSLNIEYACEDPVFNRIKR